MLWMRETGPPWQGLPDEEEIHDKFHAPELCLDMGTTSNKYPEEEDEWKRAVCSYLKPHGNNGQRRKRKILQRSRRRGFLIQRDASTLISPIVDIYSVTITKIISNSISIPILIKVKKLLKPLDFWIVEQEDSLSTRIMQEKQDLKSRSSINPYEP